MNKSGGRRRLEEFRRLFASVVGRKGGRPQHLKYYFMVAHPGTTEKEARELADFLRELERSGEKPVEGVQIFTPTPMTRSTCMYHTGLDPITGGLLHTTARMALPRTSLAVVSGPSFAGEVARGLPTAVTVASDDSEFAARIAGLLHGGRFRAYTSGDMVGVEISGAAKNVLAIATGIADGLGFGANARAALITRGLSELIRLGSALGGRPETFTGLAGVGDLVLTCTDDQSRNRRMGLALARGLSVDQAKSEIGQEVEGVPTARSVHRLAHSLHIEMPIAYQVYRVLYKGVSPLEATAALLEREPKPEFG